jgi:hypothetical protein
MSPANIKALRALSYSLETRVRHEHGYEITTVYLQSGDLGTLADRADGAKDNKAGYGTTEAAHSVYRETLAMMEQGHTHYMCTALASVSLSVAFQKVRSSDATEAPRWCQASFEHMGREPDRILAASRILEALVKRHGTWGNYQGENIFHNPRAFANALQNLLPNVYTCDRIGWVDVVTAFPSKAPRARKAA